MIFHPITNLIIILLWIGVFNEHTTDNKENGNFLLLCFSESITSK